MQISGGMQRQLIATLLLVIGFGRLAAQSARAENTTVVHSPDSIAQRRLPEELTYIEGADDVKAGVDTVKAVVDVINEPSFRNLGNVFIEAASITPLLTFIGGPYGAVIGFGMASIGHMFAALGQSDAAPSNTDINSAILQGLSAMNKKLNKAVNLAEQTLILVEEIHQIVKEESLGFRMFEEINTAFQNVWGMMVDTDEFLGTRLREYRSYYENRARTFFKVSNLRAILDYAATNTIKGNKTWCGAAQYVHWFTATRYQHLWLLLTQISYQAKDRSTAKDNVEREMALFLQDMEAYENLLRSVQSDDLLYAIQTSASDCVRLHYGTRCNFGKPKWSEPAGGCRCDELWQGEKTARSMDQLVDGALHRDCTVNPYTCSTDIDIRIINRGTGHWVGNHEPWNKFLDVLNPALTDPWVGTKAGQPSDSVWRIRSAGEGKVHIVNTEGGVYLENYQGGPRAIQTWHFSWSAMQWRIEDAGKGEVYLKSVADGKYLYIDDPRRYVHDDDQNSAKLSSGKGDYAKFKLKKINGQSCSPEFKEKDVLAPFPSSADLFRETTVTAAPTQGCTVIYPESGQLWSGGVHDAGCDGPPLGTLEMNRACYTRCGAGYEMLCPQCLRGVSELMCQQPGDTLTWSCTPTSTSTSPAGRMNDSTRPNASPSPSPITSTAPSRFVGGGTLFLSTDTTTPAFKSGSAASVLLSAFAVFVVHALLAVSSRGN